MTLALPDSAAAVGRRQGLQLRKGPQVPPTAWDQGGDPDPQGPAASAAVRQGGLSAAQHRGTVHRLAQGEPTGRDAVREVGDQLLGDGQTGHDAAMPANT